MDPKLSNEREIKEGKFRGIQIPDFEVNLLQELESQLKKEFVLVKNIQWDTKMGFSVENNRVTGLGLCGCGLSALPEAIGNLSSLEILWCIKNRLEVIPESIGGLRSLKQLWMNDNQLDFLPDSFGNLKSLKILALIRNKFKNLPDSIGNLSSLEILWLNKNQISSLPESIGNLSSLKILWCTENRLEILPESIGDLRSLKQLWMSENQLNLLPESIGNLSSLETLWLNKNQLSSLPVSIGNLKSLQLLGIGENNLKTLPKSITKLKQTPLFGSGLQLENGTFFLHESISPKDIKPPLKVFLDDKDPMTLSDALETLEQKGVKILTRSNKRSRKDSGNKLVTCPICKSKLKIITRQHINSKKHKEALKKTGIEPSQDPALDLLKKY